MRDSVKQLAVMCISFAALYYGFTQDVFIGRLYIYGLMTIMGLGALLTAVLAVLMRKPDVTYDPLKSIEYCERVSNVPIWKHIVAFLSTGVIIGFFCATNHGGLALIYGGSVFVMRVALYSIQNFIKNLVMGNI